MPRYQVQWTDAEERVLVFGPLNLGQMRDHAAELNLLFDLARTEVTGFPGGPALGALLTLGAASAQFNNSPISEADFARGVTTVNFADFVNALTGALQGKAITPGGPAPGEASSP